MKKIFLLVCVLTTLCLLNTYSQTTFTVNGPYDVRTNYVAYTHATVYVQHDKIINDATLLIKDGIVVSVIEKGAVPKDAKEVNLMGRTVYPSFIDLYSNYGVSLPAPTKQPQPQEQFNSTKPGAYAWNEALKPEVDASGLFAVDEQKATLYRAMGFGMVLTGLHDGICRGTTALVLTSNDVPHKVIIKSNVSSSFSFNKGTSRQPYPSSLMGTIALIRQTYYDAIWYGKQNQEKNHSLEAFNKLIALPTIFDAGNKFNVLRAGKLAKEFGLNVWIKSNGDDYQRWAEIKENGYPLIVPINFPKPYKITSPYDAQLISTADLKHWEMAPANLYWLWKNKVKFTITSSGHQQANAFLSNLRKAVKYGIPENEVLKALTIVPAEMIGEKRAGKLQPGSFANFIVCNGNLFDSKTVILQQVVQGKEYVINQPEVLSFYEQTFTSSLKKLSSIDAKHNKAFFNQDSVNMKLNTEELWCKITFADSLLTHYNGYITKIDSTVFPYRIVEFDLYLNEEKVKYAALPTLSKSEKKEGLATILLHDSLIWFPFNDYGSPQIKKASTVVFKNATVWTNEDEGILEQTDVLIDKGKIVAIGKNLSVAGALIIDASNKHLTSGIIDEHSHIAITNGVNEGTQTVTSEVRIGDAINADDINIYRQLAGGVIGAQLLHGSANPIGGQSAVIKLRWGLAPEQLKTNQPFGFIKFALGENVKQSNWGDASTIRYPQTRMGVEQVFFDAFIRARAYENRLKLNPNERRDLELEALIEVLNGKRLITCHSYVQSEINMLMHVADSFKFRINTFTHILEGYKVADKMKRHGVHASTFADWWAYKFEVIDAIPYNAAILNRMGVLVAINSDDAEMGRRLNQEAAKTIKYGGLSEIEAWKTVTLNPAKMLKLDHITGSIKPGKDADLVLWSDNPLSIYSKVLFTFVNGICYYSEQDDLLLRLQTNETRQRIINKLIKEQNQEGEPVPFISVLDPNYHCND
ncbi:MAG: amidohydrolase family protein [Bacteroidia bacterium]|nr:amidohydrolase family protein [Bacteroidia bacterium]